MRRMPGWGEGSARGEASQVGLEGRGGSCGLSPVGHWGAMGGSELGAGRSVLWNELSGCLVWETRGGWGRHLGAEGTIRTRKDHRNGEKGLAAGLRG